MPTAHEALAELARRELSRREARTSVEAFCARTDSSYRATSVSRIICAHLDALANGEIEKLAIFMPPGAGKTYHAGQRFPAYMLGRFPKTDIVSASYTLELAQDSSRTVRELIRSSESWPWPQTKIADDQSAVTHWRTSTGGAFRAVGVGGSLTGFHPRGLIIDDPIKGPEEVSSAQFREKQWRWYTQVALTRQSGVHGRTWQLFMLTRWHEDDLAARALNAFSDWTVLQLPLYAEENDPLGRAIGEPLPDYPLEKVLSVEEGQISSRAFGAMYQQHPTAETGNLFQRAWFEYRATLPTSFRSVIQTIDCATKTGVSNDYSVIATWGFDGMRYHVIDIWREKVEFPDLLRAAIAAYEWYQPAAVLIEDASAGTQLIQQFRASALPIIAIPALGSKVSRAEAITPLFESGRVVLPPSAPWVETFIEEHVAFPNTKHDDQVDTTSMALARLQDIANHVRPFAVRA